MKPPKPYKLKKRKNGIYYVIDKITKKAKSLKTEDKDEADELAKAEYNVTDCTNAAHHMKMAEAHLAHCNPDWNTNTWGMVADGVISGPRRGGLGGEKKLRTVLTLQTFWNNKCWDHMRNKRLIDTLPNDFLRALENTGAGNLKFGRQLHSYAGGHMMMPIPIMGSDMWPVRQQKGPLSLTITEGEHLKVAKYVSTSGNRLFTQYPHRHKGTTSEQWRDEWVAYLSLLWWTGASQGDAANMIAENIKWDEGVLEYKRGKWMQPEKHAPVRVGIAKGGEFEKLLKSLPQEGNLFPLLASITVSNRSRFFRDACNWCDIRKGVSLHGYRFALAERAKENGMSAADLMTTLGHSDMNMTHHYDMNAKTVPASIEVLDGGLKAA